MKRISYIIIALAALILSSCKDDDAPTAVTPQQEVTTVNVDVILPQTQWTAWQPAINDALRALDDAQESCPKRVKLNLRYHDEDSDDLEALAYALTHPGKGTAPYVQPDMCHAIIGPYHSSHARTFLNQARLTRLPVLMPTCSSAELQRSEARQTNSFFLTESDITQCEVLLTSMQALNCQRVGLLYSDDNYGQSFRDWLGFVATQLGMEVIPGGIRAYTPGDALQDYYSLTSSDRGDNQSTGLIVALTNVSDYIPVMEECKRFDQAQKSQPEPKESPLIFVSDTGFSPLLLSYELFGTYPQGSTSNGYVQTYQTDHHDIPPYGAAQMYDALTMIALGRAAQLYAADPEELSIDGQRVQFEIAPYGPVLSDWIRAVVAADDPAPVTLWIGYGLASAFRLIEQGTLPSLRGATGDMDFDLQTRTNILHTNYLLWESNGTGTILPYLSVSTGNSSKGFSTNAIWNWQAIVNPIDPDAGAGVGHQLPDLHQRWAVVISPSTTWENYRHQADALAMYHLLKDYGYDDDHIVLIVEDNLAYAAENPYPGEIFLERSMRQDGDMMVNANVRQGVTIDYKFSDLASPDDLADILLGRQSDRLSQVIHSTESDNVFLFWSGHGGDSDGPLWGNENSRQPFGTQRIKDIVSQLPYRRMMMALESCYSGLWGEALKGQPDVLVLTAANAYETSKPDVYDATIGNYLSNAFSRSFLRLVGSNPSVSISDLYYQLALTTAGSHVTLYNIEQYGSANTNTMSDYFDR